MTKLLDGFQDPKEILFMLKQPDFHNKDLLWYMDEYDQFSMLNS